MISKIKKFVLEYAEYAVQDEGGEVYRLIINYRQNNFFVVGEASEIGERVAKDLLRRNRGVNFAGKFSDKIN